VALHVERIVLRAKQIDISLGTGESETQQGIADTLNLEGLDNLSQAASAGIAY
jgi:hypothetical protein